METNIEIEELMEEIEKLKGEKEYAKCLLLIEDNIHSISEKYSKDSKEYYTIAESICDLCYETAVEYFEMNFPDEGIKYLDKCALMFNNYPQILHVCYTNQGHYHRRLKQIDKALIAYDKSISISTELKNKKNTAIGHLNYANTIFPLGKIQLAIEQTLAAIILLQEELIDNETNDQLFEDVLIEAYCFVAFLKGRQGEMLESLFYYDIVDLLLKNSTVDITKIMTINEDDKYKMFENYLRNRKDELGQDKNEQMASNYIKDQVHLAMKNLDRPEECKSGGGVESGEEMDKLGRFQEICKKQNC